MKIIVGAKRVVDANIKVRVKTDNSDVDITHSKMSLNPFDENAIEEAIRLKENGVATEIIAISIGTAKCIDILRIALARGADRAILVETNDKLDPINIAKIYKYLVNKEQADLILLGKQAIDDDANQVGQMLAGMINCPQGTFISKLTVNNDKKIQVERTVDSGTEILEISTPAVLTTDLHLNEPRFIKLPQLMAAKKKTIEHLLLEDLNITIKRSSQLLKAFDGEQKKICKMLNNVDDIINILHEKKTI